MTLTTTQAAHDVQRWDDDGGPAYDPQVDATAFTTSWDIRQWIDSTRPSGAFCLCAVFPFGHVQYTFTPDRQAETGFDVSEVN